MFRAQTDIHRSHQKPGRFSAPRVASSRRLACGVMLAGACLLGVAWGGTTRPLDRTQARGGGSATSEPNDALSVETLLRQLEDRRPAVRREAVVRLGSLGPSAEPAVPLLM